MNPASTANFKREGVFNPYPNRHRLMEDGDWVNGDDYRALLQAYSELVNAHFGQGCGCWVQGGFCGKQAVCPNCFLDASAGTA